MWPYGKDVVSNPGYKYILISGYGIMAVMLCLLFGIWALSPRDRRSTQDDSSTIVLGGGRIVVFEFPARTPVREHISVYDNGSVKRSAIPSKGYDGFTEQTLAPEQQQAIDDLRAEWCRTPRPSSQPSVVPYYDIRVDCGFRRAQHALLPADALPPILATLVETLPSP